MLQLIHEILIEDTDFLKINDLQVSVYLTLWTHFNPEMTINFLSNQ